MHSEGSRSADNVRWHVSYGRTLYGRRRWEITVTVSWNVGNRTTVNKDTAARPAASVRYTKLSASKFKNLCLG